VGKMNSNIMTCRFWQWWAEQ